MKIELTPSLERMVREKIDTGLYDDAADVVRDALQQMQERDQKERAKASSLLKALDLGLSDVAEGRYEVFATTDELDAFFKTL